MPPTPSIDTRQRPHFKTVLARRVIASVVCGFILIVLLIWVDEFYDLNATRDGISFKTLRLAETLVETVLILMLALATVMYLLRFIRRIKHLEGLLPVCASCKNIRVGDQWIPIEAYIAEHSDALFSHGICPDCARKLYGDRGQGLASLPPTQP
jgi:hypothetical protein